MKNFILSASILFITASPIFAQGHDRNLSSELEAKCTELTRSMVNELRLNEIGYIKLKELNRERISKVESAKESLTGDIAALNLELQNIESDFEQKLTSLLDASQLQAYAAYKRNTNVNYMAVSDKK